MRTHTLAIVSLIFGLLSWIGLPLVGAIVAVITGHLARAEITRSPEQFDGNGMALAGLILGWLNLALSLLALAAIFLFFGGLAFLLAMAH
ncbi:MAG: hypothetical protein COW59_10475 [Lysobacterales bacterium CG17_big_fil_post_rev_8_21_14_2_50_64_11]|nr:MAG: hypothetical protein COW59_10475 [Xanthomonadales bacterium CG17_big_fil_post_rev_8_21_14_2_50_64_11]PIX59686.1 MAG: hypothetical protein COZ47_11215 [Xanthomonadales bacterium CG_4_10_14_3_um_filter_64_11]